MTRIDHDTGKKIGRLPDYSKLQFDAQNGATYDNLKPNVDMCCTDEPHPENPVLPYTQLKQAKTHIALVTDKEVLGPLATGSTDSAAPFTTVKCGAIFWFGLQRSTVDPVPSLANLYLQSTVTPGIAAPSITRIWPLSSYTVPTWSAVDPLTSTTTDWFSFRTDVTKFFYDFLQGGAVINSQLFGPGGSYGLLFQVTQTLNSGWSNVTNGVVATDIGKNVLRTGFPNKYPTYGQEPGFYPLRTAHYGAAPNTAPSTNTTNITVWWSGDPLDPMNLPTLFACWSLNPVNLGSSFSCGILNYLTGGVDFTGIYHDDWWQALHFADSNPPRLHL